MIELLAEDVLFQTEDALIHDAHTGFKEDYLVIHSLLRKYKPESLFEIGTNIGSGINVMARACIDTSIFSLDLDYETMKKNSKQYPIGPNGEDRVGSAVNKDILYSQLRGDSMTFDYSRYPCEAYFIDGEHDFDHPYHESLEVLKLRPKLVIWHDADMPEVWKAILQAQAVPENYENYNFYRVTDTRIAFAVKIEKL